MIEWQGCRWQLLDFPIILELVSFVLRVFWAFVATGTIYTC